MKLPKIRYILENRNLTKKKKKNTCIRKPIDQPLLTFKFCGKIQNIYIFNCCKLKSFNAGVKIRKSNQGWFGPLMLYFEGPHNLLRAKIFFFANSTYNGITVTSKSAGPAGPPSVTFEGPPYFNFCFNPFFVTSFWKPLSVMLIADFV